MKRMVQELETLSAKGLKVSELHQGLIDERGEILYCSR